MGPGAKVNIKLHGYDDRRKKEVSSGRGTTHLLPIYEAHEVGFGVCLHLCGADVPFGGAAGRPSLTYTPLQPNNPTTQQH